MPETLSVKFFSRYAGGLVITLVGELKISWVTESVQIYTIYTSFYLWSDFDLTKCLRSDKLLKIKKMANTGSILTK